MTAKTAGVAFAKMNGAGNDFVMVDGTGGTLAGVDLSVLARAVCRRRFSIGADGLIVLVEDPEVDFAWAFYNADGSEAEMCGNGARCAVRFAHERGIAAGDVAFRTKAGVIRGRVTDRGARVQMTTPGGYRGRFDLNLDGTVCAAYFVDSGVPHAVIPVEDIAEVDVRQLGRVARFHEAFKPAGTNANFIAPGPEGKIYARTYERGVEAETMACGTGAVASAIVAAHLGWGESPVTVITSGGGELSVRFDGGWEEHDDVFLEGDARLVYEGTWTADALAAAGSGFVGAD